ncbi:MAG: hypothetical protein M3203_02880, partial [Actinomycetota bacterium]|nr:hypothetical protein [Actinomycetota bacterium]
MVRAPETGRREGPDLGAATVVPDVVRRRRPSPRRAVRWWSEHAGAVIAAAALLAFVLGIVGFAAFIPGRRFTDYVYRSLELFVVYVEHTGLEDTTASMPLTLEVARFLAPAAAAAASIRALLALFGQRAARAWARYFVRNHVLVCGLGPVGTRLALA